MSQINTITLTQNDDWVVFTTFNKNLIQLFKSQIPTEYRKFINNQWLVYWTKLPILVTIIAKFYHVDYASLPSRWQMSIAGAKVQENPASNILDNYRDLHLQPTAPIELVRAVYEFLVLQYHPDHNGGLGDTEALGKVMQAYREIRKNNVK